MIKRLLHKLPIGTRSVLCGAHTFWWHPFFVALAWWKLYGFPYDPRLWFAFFLHDIGYIGKPNMDGPEGESHPEVGANIMWWLFDWRYTDKSIGLRCTDWYCFTLYHSRYYAKRRGQQPSRLCVADKLATCLTPASLYVPAVRRTGELAEYMDRSSERILSDERLDSKEKEGMLSGDAEKWYTELQNYMWRWVEEHKDGKVDEWTATR